MKRFLIIFTLFCAAATTSVWADLVAIEHSTQGSGGGPEVDTLYATPTKVAVLTGSTGGMIYLADQKRMLQFDTSKGIFTEYTADTMKKLNAKSRKILEDTKARMEKQLKSMSKDQQTMMQQIIDKMGQPSKYTYKRLGPKVTVGKWSCIPVDQFVDGEEKMKLWVVPASSVGVSAADTAGFSALEDFLGTSGGGFSEPGLDKFLGFKAFKIKSQEPGSDGNTTTVTSISHHAAPPGTYSIPAGLKKTPPPGL